MLKQRPTLPGLHPLTLLIAYTAIALAPLAIAASLDLPPRPFLDELSSALALVGFSMLLLEFVLSGRFKTASGRLGIDITMRFHQLVARTLVVFILIHPFLYTIPLTSQLPWDTSGQHSLGITNSSMVSGILAWLLLPTLVVWALFQRESGYRYETWRLCHGIGAALIALFGLHHAIVAGRYSDHEVMAVFWYVMTAIAMLTLLQVYVLGPLRQLRHPYHVVSIQPVAHKTWELVIEPGSADKPTQQGAMNFLPGQFVWLTLKCSPFAITEHPFSISSCPAERPRIGFTIKEVGDFTNTIGSIPIGTCAYLDGPHGHLVLEGRKGSGLAFIAGGSGLAPIMSMLRQLRNDKDTRPIKLIYGNRVADQILYRQELDQMQEVLDIEIDYILGDPPPGWDGKVGQLDIDSLRSCLVAGDCAQWLYVVCGPAPMIDSVEHNLEKLGVPLKQIISERFSQN